MSYTKHKNEIVYESFSGQKHSQLKILTERSMKNTDKILTGYSVLFLVGAFLGKSARLLQWLVFFIFFSSDYNLTLIGPLFIQSKLLKLLA